LAEVNGPAGAVVLHVHVNLAGQQRLAGDRGTTEVDLVVDVRAGSLVGLDHHLAEDQLLVEVLRADGEVNATQVVLRCDAISTGVAT